MDYGFRETNDPPPWDPTPAWSVLWISVCLWVAIGLAVYVINQQRESHTENQEVVSRDFPSDDP